jgi:hypothetical protein
MRAVIGMNMFIFVSVSSVFLADLLGCFSLQAYYGLLDMKC